MVRERQVSCDTDSGAPGRMAPLYHTFTRQQWEAVLVVSTSGALTTSRNTISHTDLIIK